MESRHISVFIDRPVHEVYEFTRKPENLPLWASGLGESIKKVKGGWVADSPMGKIRITFAKKNEFGVLDHDVTLESGVTIRNPMRVIPNGTGSDIVFSLVRQHGMDDKKFSDDAAWVEKDLNTLKQVMENAGEKQLIEKLMHEGYTNVRACPVGEPGKPFSDEHTHDVHTVHIITDGELTLIDKNGTHVLKKGMRFEIPAGTRHIAKTGPKGCRFVVGVKEGKG